MSDTMRGAFEAWITKPLKNGRSLSDAMNDQQREIAKETWCDAWQAAQSQPAPPVPATVQEIIPLVNAYTRACAEFDASIDGIDKAEDELNAAFVPLEAALTALVDDNHRLKFEMDGVRAMRGPEWQTIETAPKDGTFILLGSSAGAWIARYLPVYQSGYTPENPWQSMMLNHDHMPRHNRSKATHWMPLPPPPTHGIEPEQGDNHG